MSWFDFGNMGEKIFTTPQEAEQKIKEHLEREVHQFTDIVVRFDEGRVLLEGKVPTAEIMEEAIKVTGGIEGVVGVDSRIEIVSPVSATPEPEYYVIKKGDTLGAIAKKYYGNVMKYKELFEANKNVLEHPDRIYPGQKIVIPKL